MLDQLNERGRHLAYRCLLFTEDEETIEHIMVHCMKVWDLWALLFALSLVLIGFSLVQLERHYLVANILVQGKKTQEDMGDNSTLSI